MKVILQSNYFYLCLFIILCFSFFLKKDQVSIYDIKDSEFYLTIDDFNYDDNKISFTFNGKEDLIGSYYYKDKSIIDELKYGREVVVKGSLYVISHNTIPNTFDYHDYLKYKGIYYGIKIKEIEFKDESNSFIYKIKNIIFSRIKKIDDSGYMMAFILGDKSYIDKDNYKAYQNIGVAHLFALSGMHISLISGLILFFLKRLDKNIKYIIVCLVLIMYGFIVGYPASILRCIIFFSLSCLNKIFDFEISNIKLLLLTAFIILFMNIYYLYDSGFIYSFSCVFGIFWSNKYIKGRYKSLKLSFVSFLFTLPVSLYLFYSINFLSIIYNLIFIPYVSLIVYPLSLLSFIFPFLYKIFYFSIRILNIVAFMLDSIRLFRLHLSFNMVEVVLFYLLALLFIWKDNKLFLLMCLLIIFVDIFIPYLDSNAYVYFLDVNQGDSCLVISANRKDVIMIDTGGMDNYSVSDNVISFLYSLGIDKIDLLILSHGDRDHAGEIANLLKNIKIEHLKLNKGELSEYELIARNNISISPYEAKNMYLTYLNYKDYDNENDNSVLTYIKINGVNILSMGDASYTVENDLINKYKINVDILKVSHHGSKTSSDSYFINSINPKYSVISVGKNNKYGHPNKEVLNNLKNTKIYRTDLNGTISFKIKNSKYFVVDVIQ